MADDVKQDVNEQEVVDPAKTTESSTPEQAKEETAPKEGSKDYNWRRMEQKMAELERKNQELAQVVQSYQKPVEPEPDEFESLQDDDLITKAYLEKAAEKKARQIVQDELAARERAALPIKTKQQFEDYEQVVTNENLEKLIREDPDLEYDIQHAKNPYARAYKAIKQASFYREEKASKPNIDRINANTQKPVNSASLGVKNSPLDKANAYASWSREDLYREMMNAAKRAGDIPNL